MADRYWVGGTGTWDGTSTTNWSASSGGATGASVPTAADNVFFNVDSNIGTGAFTVTMATTPRVCNDFTASGLDGAMTLAGASIGLTVSGSLTFQATNFSPTYTGATTLNATTAGKTVTTNGVTFPGSVTFNGVGGVWTLGSAITLNSTSTLTVSSGTFNAATYNVTVGLFSASGNTIIKMGSGTWTLSGAGSVWSTLGYIYAGTSTVLLSSTSSSITRTFLNGGTYSNYLNKLTIGGATGNSTIFTITSSCSFGEIASTKTVAHTINLASNSNITVGKWAVTGTAGNVVTLAPTTAATPYTLIIAGPATTAINYLSISYCTVSTISPGEFYVGVNSTNTAGNTGAIFFTATPTPRTLYWVGGTGNWSATTSWATSSGGASGAAIPTSVDSVTFDSLSNATSYTATIDAGVTIARCAAFSMAGPLVGNVTFAGGIPIAFHGNFLLAATGVNAFTNTGTQYFSGNASYTITTNGVGTYNGPNIFGTGSTWTLGSAFNAVNSGVTASYGAFNTNNYALNCGGLYATQIAGVRSISLGSSTCVFDGSSNAFQFQYSVNLTFNAGTSNVTLATGSGSNIFGGNGVSGNPGETFYNVTFTPSYAASSTLNTISGANTFNSLIFSTVLNGGSVTCTINNPITIQTLTLSAGAKPGDRRLLRSGTPGTSVTLTVATLTAGAADTDFSDIVAAGASGTWSGDRFGNCYGNSNITFPAPKTVYFAILTSAPWNDNAWSATLGGAVDPNMFPLAQDTAIIPAGYPTSGNSISFPSPTPISTVDLSARTSNTVGIRPSSNISVYGNWINGTGVTIPAPFGGYIFSFLGRTTQLITGAGVTFSHSITVDNLTGTLQLQSDLSSSVTVTVTSGTLALQSYTLTTGRFSSSNSNTRTIAFGTGQISCTDTGTVWTTNNSAGLTTTGTQVVNVTSVGSTAITINVGTLSQANSISYNFTGGTYALTFLADGSGSVRSVNFTGFAGTLGGILAATVYGNLTLSTGMTLTASTNTLTFGATSGTQQITSNTKTIDFPLTFNGVGGTFQLQDALTMGSTRTATLTNGTLNLQSFTLSTGLFSSTNSNTRTIAFGTGQITCTGTGTVWTTATSTNLTTSGTQIVNVTSVGSTAITVSTGTLSESNSISFNFTGGTYALSFLSTPGYTARNVDFTGYAGTLGTTSNPVIYGNFKLSSGMTLSSSFLEMRFGATSGTQQITTNAKTIDFPLNFNGAGGTRQLQDALTMGSTRTATLTNGTLNLNGKTLTVGTAFTTATGTKNLTFNGGTLVCPAATTTAFNNAVPTGFTTTAGTGVGTISMTAATAKTFVGGGSTFNCALNQGGAGDLSITGSNTFSNITNTVQPASILFTAGTTSTFTSFSLSGTAGNLITIGSVTAASHTLSKASGTVSVSFCSISRSNGTGGATWEAFTTNGNVDGGNNTGWTFGGVIYSVFITESASSIDSIVGYADFYSAVQELASGVDQVDAALIYLGVIEETGSGIDQVDASQEFASNISETGSGIDQVDANFSVNSNLSENASGVDEVFSAATFATDIAESGSGVDDTSALQTFVTDVAESASGVDQADAAQTFVTDVAESGSGIDQVDTSFTVNSNASETASGVDSSSSVAVFLTDVNEAASGIDSVSSAQTFATDVAEANSGLDQINAAQRFVTNVAETGAALDQVDVKQTFKSSITERASGVDSDSVAASTFNAYSAEAASGIDRVSSSAAFESAISEAGSGVDAVSTKQVFATNVVEAGSGIDQVDAAQRFASSVTEAASGVDSDSVAASTFNAYAVETASGLDSDSVAASTFNAYSAEAASGIDAISAKQVFGSDVAEAASGVDAISATQRFASAVTEAASGGDQVDAAQGFKSSISETASGVDSGAAIVTFNVFASETASGVDAVSSRAEFGSAVDENASTIADISAKQTFATVIDETASGIDAPSVAASIFNASLAETASGVDSISSNSIFGSSIAEAASGVDDISATLIYASDITESASGVDSIFATQDFAVFIAETASGLDSFTVAASIFNAAFTDSASGIDTIQPNFTYNITVPEGVSAFDQFIGGYLWNPVDDTQNADWGDISNIQAAGWASVDDNQTANWQNVSNTNAPGWDSVNNTQSPSWTDVQTH